MSEILAAFPAPEVAYLVKVGRKNLYRTPDGDFQRCTSILEALPKQRFLVPWAANLERQAVIEAAGAVMAEGVEGGIPEFMGAIEAKLGWAREHQKKLTEGGDIGTAAHNEIQRRTRLLLGLPAGPEVALRDESLWAVMAWEDWFKTAGLKPLRCEQTVWDKASGVAGTVDLLAFNDAGELGIVDYKTSKGIYDDHHVQVAKYCQMAGNFAEIQWANIVRTPKNVADPEFEVKTLGDLSWTGKDGRRTEKHVTLEQLLSVYEAAHTIYKTFIE